MAKRGRGRPIIETLTEPQKRLLLAIETYISRHGMSPTMRELAEELEHGVASVFKQVERLERNGYVSRVAGKSRSLTVIRSANDESLIGLVTIPLVGTVVAGHPLMAQENLLGELLVDASTVRSGRHFALKVSGQSMINAGISSGDVVIVRQQPLADHRDIVVALLNDEATVKRLHYRSGEVSLLPENPNFKPIPVGPDDDLRIIGKVVAVRAGSG
ncbi:MAG: transcriptional repressor LexA [Planctomycetota bacterium]